MTEVVISFLNNFDNLAKPDSISLLMSLDCRKVALIEIVAITVGMATTGKYCKAVHKIYSKP